MAEIKISELSVGDWVEIDGEPAKALCLRIVGGHIFKGVSGQMYRCLGGMDFEPIPLTPEILEKNGFVKLEKAYGDIMYELHIKQGELRYRPRYTVFENNHHRARNLKHQMLYFSIDEYTNGGWICIKRNQGKPLYLHELQHLLRLAGVEKEIEV